MGKKGPIRYYEVGEVYSIISYVLEEDTSAGREEGWGEHGGIRSK